MIGEEKQGVGPLIGSIIVVLVILIGGFYALQTGVTLTPTVSVPPVSSSSPITIITSTSSETASVVSSSTEIKDIEADAKAVDTKSIDSGLDNLDLLVNQ